jgi:hypothetical protein
MLFYFHGGDLPGGEYIVFLMVCGVPIFLIVFSILISFLFFRDKKETDQEDKTKTP